MPRNITYTHIAKAAGVSRMTVSLALRNHPYVAKETARKVRETAEKLGYRPDPEINRLMSYLRTARGARPDSVVAFLDPWPKSKDIPDRYHLQLLLGGVNARCEELGFTSTVLWLKEPGMTLRRMNSILYARGIRGLLIPPLPRGRGHLTLDWDRYACVAMDDVMKPDLHRVTADQFGNAMLAFRRLRKLHYRRVGFVEETFLEEKTDHAYSSAFYWHCQQVAASDVIPPLIAPRIDPGVILRYVRRHRPEVLVGMITDALVREAGLRVPEDVAVASLYNTRTDGTLAGIHPIPATIGAAAVDLLFGQLLRNETGVPANFKHINIRGLWVDGLSAPGLPERTEGRPAKAPQSSGRAPRRPPKADPRLGTAKRSRR